MVALTHTYSITRMTSSTDPLFAAAIELYEKAVTTGIRTDPEEIKNWIDVGYNKDEFCVCALSIDDRVVGFAEFAYFKDDRLVFLDYLYLDPHRMSTGLYLHFGELLQEWWQQQGFIYDYAVTEVSFDSSGDTPSPESQRELELLELLGFGVVRCAYRLPPLGERNLQSGLPGYLLVMGMSRLAPIQRATLMAILKTVYYSHYRRWYWKGPRDSQPYEEQLRRRLDAIEASLGGAQEVPVESRTRPLTRPSVWMTPTLIVGLLACIALLLVWQRYTQTSWQITLAVIAGGTFAFVVVVSFSNAEARKTLSTILEPVSSVLGKGK